MTAFDCAIIGAGVVGLAVARACALRGLSAVLLERHTHYGTETSARNSEVIHSGIYYSPGSLKAQLCVEGRDALYAYCDSRAVAYSRCGKLVVAVDEPEELVLLRIGDNAATNGVPGVRWLGAADVRAKEPALNARAGLWVPVTGIVDSHQLMTALLADFENAGGTFVPNTDVRRIRRMPDGLGVLIGGTDEIVTVRCVANCAGLHSEAVARSVEGIDQASIPHVRMAKGHYFDFGGRAPFRHLVYPVPSEGGLGVHATLDLAGRLRFGPDVEWVERLDYGVPAARADRFYPAIRRYWPGLPDDSLRPAYAGIRPKISTSSEPAADFQIDTIEQHTVPGLVCLYGIESPGLTSALPIGARVAALLASGEGSAAPSAQASQANARP